MSCSQTTGARGRRELLMAWFVIAIGILTALLSGSSRRLAAQPAATAGHHGEPAAVRERLRAQLGAGFVTEAEFVRPASSARRSAAVLLVHGATPADLDFTVARGADTSRIFRDVADGLAAQGVASLRYHKRWVSAAGKFDAARFFQTDLQALLADARVMLDSLRARPEVDPARIYLWGWSEGSAIVAQLAAHDADLAGVIVQGPVVHSFGETLRGQFARIGVPYLLRFAAADSTLDLDAIAQAEKGNGGLLARSHAMMLFEPYALRAGERKLNPMIDADSSGRIHVVREALATYERFMRGPMLGMYAEGRALPGWMMMRDSVGIPLLVLQGEADANVPVADARALEVALRSNRLASFRIYPGLGHSLGRATDPVDDDFRPVDAAPIRDAAEWINRSGRAR